MFHKGFSKTAAGATGFWNNHKALDHAGLAALAIAPAYHGYKAIKNKDKKDAAIAGTELGGLALLSRAVAKSK
jgi:hypothetical protein